MDFSEAVEFLDRYMKPIPQDRLEHMLTADEVERIGEAWKKIKLQQRVMSEVKSKIDMLNCKVQDMAEKAELEESRRKTAESQRDFAIQEAKRMESQIANGSFYKDFYEKTVGSGRSFTMIVGEKPLFQDGGGCCGTL